MIGNPEGVNKSLVTDMNGKKTIFYYRELYPNEKIVLHLKAPKKCNDNFEKIGVEDIEVVKFYYSAIKKKRIPIVVKNYYLETPTACQKAGGSGFLEKKIVIGPFKFKMAHIRVVATEDISVSYSDDCGNPPKGQFYNEFCSLVAL
jgi:hypothetical protein